MQASTFHTINARVTGNFIYKSHTFFGDLTRSILPTDSIDLYSYNTHKLEHKTSSSEARYVKWNGGGGKSRDFKCMS